LYMSPQQLRGDDPAGSDDIYAFGATLYELLTGKPPFHTGDVAWQIREANPKPVNARLAMLGLDPVPAEWDETIQSCLAKGLENRPKSAREVAQRFRLSTDFADGADEKKPGAAGRSAEPQPALNGPNAERKNRSLVIAGAIVLAVSVLAYAFWQHSPAAPSPLRQVEQVVPKLPIEPREFIVAVDPPDVGARLWLGPLSDVEVKNGRAVLKDLPDGEQELSVQAKGYQLFATRVTVKDGRGSVEAKLVPVRGAVSVTARPGTQVSVVDERGREMRVGSVPPGGVLDVANLLTVGRYTLKLEHADCAPVSVPDVELLIGRTIKVVPEQMLLPGELRVFSVPTGAEVRVNGTFAGSTPATIKNQPSEQTLQIEVFLRGYRRLAQEVALKPKEVRTVNVGTLVAEAGRIELRFADGDLGLVQAAISIDGKPINAGSAFAAGPLHIDNLEVGARTVEIKHPDYEPWRQSVIVRDQETTAVNVELKPRPGTVVCETTPAGARVVINDGDRPEATVIGSGTQAETLTPMRGMLPPGTYTLRFELKGYKSVTRTATVEANRTVEVSVALEKFHGAEEARAGTVPGTVAATNPDGSKDTTETVAERDRNGNVISTKTSLYRLMPDGTHVDIGSVKDEPNRVTITDAVGNTFTVPKSLFRGNEATVYETQYVGGKGQKLTGERELTITLKRDEAGRIVGFDQHYGLERQWDFVIAEAPDARKFENDSMATRLVFRDNGQKTDFRIEAWNIKNRQGQEVDHFGAQNEVEVKFHEGLYTLIVTGKTDWGNRFSVSVNLNVKL